MADVVLMMDEKKAERLTSAVADFTCWLAGFRAARPEMDLNDLDISGLRELLGDMKDARAKARGDTPEPLPF